MAYNILMIFFIILSIFDVFIIKQKKNKILIIMLAFFIYLFFFGFRGFIAWDWYNYYPNYERVIPLYDTLQNDKLIFNEGYTSFEKGYQVWLSFLKMFFSNWNSYLFFTTFIDITCLLIIFYKYSPYPIFSILVFLGFSGLQIQLDLMRNFKAILIFLFSIEYLSKEKNVKYLILNFVGCYTHRTSVCFLPLVIFIKRSLYKYKKSILLIFFIGIFILLFSNKFLYFILKFIKDVFSKLETENLNKLIWKLEYYLSTSFSNSRGIGIGFVERIFTFILFYLYRNKLNENKYEKIFFNIFLLYIFTYLYGSGVRIIFERLGLLFICSYWILYPILLKKITSIKKIFLFIFIILLCLLKVDLYIASDKAKELYKYKNILWNKETYKEKSKIYEKVLLKYDMNSQRN